MFKKLFSKLFLGRSEVKTMSVDVSRSVAETSESTETLKQWLTNIHFVEYLPLFVKSGYNLPTIARMTPEDLNAVGITNPIDRQRMKTEIDKLHFTDSLLEFKPDSLMELLQILHLEEYFHVLCQQGYQTVDKLTELTWEDLEEIGVKKLGHQKRLILAAKRIRDLDNCGKSNSAMRQSFRRLLPTSTKLNGQQYNGGGEQGRNDECNVLAVRQTDLLKCVSPSESFKRENTHGNGSQLTTSFASIARPTHLFLPLATNHFDSSYQNKMKCKQNDVVSVNGSELENNTYCSIYRRNGSLYKNHSTTPTTSSTLNGFTTLRSRVTTIPALPYANANVVKSSSRGSLEDQTSDIGQDSCSGSSSSGTSSVSSTGSRNSTVSLDSGRASDMDTKNAHLNRLSVHSCESVGSYTRGISGCHSSSQSSLGSGTSGVTTDAGDTSAVNTPISYANSDGIIVEVSVAEMILHGVSDSEVLQSWLTSFHYEEYMPLFLKAGYDMPTISRMTPEDLTAIGITKPSHRRKVKAEIQKLNISDGIPTYKPETLEEWLKLLRLHEYYVILCQQGYDTIDRVIELTWEDLEEIGIKKLGHQKRLMLAIKRIRDLDKGVKRTSAHFANNSQSTSSSSISNDSLGSSVSFNYKNSVQSPGQMGQMVPIQTSLRSKSVTSPTVETPTTPELKTFQQLPASEVNRNSVALKQMNYAPFVGLQMSGEPNSVLQSSRGRSLESIDRDDIGCKSVYRFHPQYMYNYSHKVQHKSSSGYETDSEVLNHSSDMCYPYEIDGTATLHRPKGMFKTRPVAKIVAKTRQIDNNVTFESFDSVADYKAKNGGNCVTVDEKSMDNINAVHNSWSVSVGSNSCCDGSPARNNLIYKNQSNDSSVIYGVIKKKIAPPPPPKRTNSMKSSSAGSYMMRSLSVNDSQDDPPLPVRCNSLEAMQEQAFATCVKSIASRFQINSKDESNPPLPARNHITTPRFSWPAKSEEEFPPPPSPLPHLADSDFSANNYEDDDVTADSEFDSRVNEKESAMSSSSSSESMPFANDNIGTIKPKMSGELEVCATERHRSPTSSVMSAPSSITTSPFATILRKAKNNCINNCDKNSSNGLAGSKPLLKNLSVLPKPGSSAETISVHCSASIESRENARSQSGLSEACSPDAHQSTENVIDDIELMLANLSNQLDAILESELQSD